MTETRRMKVLALALGAVALSATVSAQVPDVMDDVDVPNYTVLRKGLATAGQPTPEVLASLKSHGFRTVINLLTEAEGARHEEAAVRAQGLRYVWVPVTPQSFSLEDVRKVKEVLDDPAAAPVLFHCSSANRVGAVWTVLQVRAGRPFPEAVKEGEKIGLKSPAMREAVRRVLGLSAEGGGPGAR